jgi:hypothetical protein
MTNPLRSFLAVLVGMGFFRLTVSVLETVLVGSVADSPITNEAEFFAIRNQSGILVAALGYNAFAALLAGYIAGKLAGEHEMLHAGIAAAVQTAAMTWEFTGGAYAHFTPVWMRIALVVLIAPAMVAGAKVRQMAREIRLQADTTTDGRSG